MSEAPEQSATDGESAGAGDDRRGVNNLIRALDVPTQAKRGFAVGILVAVGTYYFFVVASGGSPYPSLYLGALAAVLAFTVGLLATLAFTVAAAYRLSQRLD
ncbi:MAG: hypothetical protein ABEH83_11045 [Halobacterium sp.]